MKTITIATAHSENFESGKDTKIEITLLTLQEGSSYFDYVWVDDNFYRLTLNEREIRIKKVEGC